MILSIVWFLLWWNLAAPVARIDTDKTILSTTYQHKQKVYQLDVKYAFLNHILQEEVYIEQPPGFEVPGQEHKVYILKKVLYGLKQASRSWYSHIDTYLIKSCF